MLFNDRTSTWNAWSNPWFLPTATNTNKDWVNWATTDSSRRVILTQSFAPASGMPTDWLHRAALGQYKSYAVTLATNLVHAGLGNSVIRIAPEANGWWNLYSVPSDAAGQADWKAAWVNMVTAMRSVVGAHFVFDWCVNYKTWGHGRNVIELNNFYPGDAYVDIVGLDAYDENSPHWSGRWWFQVSRMGGINNVYLFAHSHGKPMSMPEWGMLPWGGAMGGGGDDPSYVAGMGNFIATHNIAYSGYWYAGDAATILNNSLGLQQLRRYFGAGGAARNTVLCTSYCAGLAK